MNGSPETTNTLLAIMAAVSALEGMLVVGACVACFLVYRRAMELYRRTLEVINGIESRQVAPVMERVNAILEDVKSVSATVKGKADRVDDTVNRMRSSVRVKASRLVGLLKGARVALETVLEGRG